MKTIKHFTTVYLKNYMVICIFLILFTACQRGFYGDITPPPQEHPLNVLVPKPVRTAYPLFSPDTGVGEEIFNTWCVRCHGESGLGDGPESDSLPLVVSPIGDSDFMRESNMLEWYSIISQGQVQRYMPAFSDVISDREIWDVITYVYSMGVTDSLIDEGFTVYQENCQTCHGESGEGDGIEARQLPVVLSDWHDPASLAIFSDLQIWKRISAGNNFGMPAFIESLSEDERWAVTSYIRNLGFSDSRLLDESRLLPDTQFDPNDIAEYIYDYQVDISGKVFNGSNEDIPLGIKVTLQVFEGRETIYQRSAIVASDDHYRFADVGIVSDWYYLVSVEHAGILFSSQVLQGRNIARNIGLDLPITIFSATTGDEYLQADRLHVFINFSQPSMIRISELYTFVNAGDHVIVPVDEAQPNIQYNLPTGAINLQIQETITTSDFSLTEMGVGEFATIYPAPAQHQTMFRYDLPYDQEKTIHFIMPIDIHTGVLAIPMDDVTLESEKLFLMDQRVVEGQLMQLFMAADLKKGEVVKVRIEGRPGEKSVFGDKVDQHMLIGFAFLFPIIALFLIWIVNNHQRLRKKKMRQDDVEYERKALLDDIVALDDLYRTNKLAVDVYRNRRNEILRDLKEILKANKEDK
ncbi:MAG: c-type cytochrome [Anaerolineaceae bacterium]|nr:c-type cytochrome [Anaerolineaceae bacterium]